MNNQTEVKTRPSFGVLWQKYGTMGIFLLLLAVLTIAKPSSIFNPDSIPQILKQSAVNILLALGEFFAILIAGIDLSVGAVAGLVGMLKFATSETRDRLTTQGRAFRCGAHLDL